MQNSLGWTTKNFPEIGQTISTDEAMELAIETAKQGRGFVSPNPIVGCVLVSKDHRLLSSGAHLKWGEDHAEINALNQVTDPTQLKGATIYVTLEPCSHQGQRGSCAEFLARQPVSRVYYGMVDPNPKVSGRGLKILKAGNKEVVHFKKYESLCKKLCEHFFFHIKNQSPFVALKVGSSLDGKIALQNGESQWITGESARRYARKLRAFYDATLVGAGTVLQDDPALDFRQTEFDGKKNNSIVLFDPKGKLASVFPKTKLSQIHSPQNIFIVTSEDCFRFWSRSGVQLIKWNPGEIPKQNLQSVLCELYRRGLSSLFVEGGSWVFGCFLNGGLVQKLYLFQSSKILGAGLSWSQFFESQKLSTVPCLTSSETRDFGQDKLHTFYF